MPSTPVYLLPALGDIATGDKLVGEKVPGTTGLLNYIQPVMSGVTNRITVTVGVGTFTFDISSNYAGQGSITTLGTIALGIWQGTPIDVTYGGTGAALTPSTGGIVYTNATTMAVLAGTATANKVLMSGATAAPTWSTATYPPTASTAGKRIMSDGTNFITSTTTMPDVGTTGKLIIGNGTNYVETTSAFATTYAAGSILFSSGANNVAGLATANNGILATSGTGVPFIASDIPTAITIGGAAIYRVGGTDVAVADGGTNLSAYVQGDILYASAATTLTRLAKDTNATRYLSNTGTTNNPAWAQIDVTTGITGSVPVANGGSGRATAITAFGLIAAGTTATGVQQTISPGILGAILTGAGTSALPVFKGGNTAFLAYRGTSSQSIPSNTATKVQLQIEMFDTGSMYDNVTNFRYTPTIAGVYHFTFNAVIQSPAVADLLVINLYKNGAAVSYNRTDSSSTLFNTGSGQTWVQMNGTTDFVELYVTQSNAAAKNAYTDGTSLPYCYLAGMLMEPT